MRYSKMCPIRREVETDGNGIWTSVTGRRVNLQDMCISYLDWDHEPGEDRTYPTHGHLQVYFKQSTWNTDRDGLIYTDPRWIKEFRKVLKELGFNPKGVDYSEQGAQSWDYVDLDVGREFLKSWANNHNGRRPNPLR